jgi:hypothetical protein
MQPEDTVLKTIDDGFKEAAGVAADEAGNGDEAAGVDDAGAPDEAGALDADAAEAAEEAGAPPRLILPDRELVRAVRMLERDGLTEGKVVALVKLASKHETHHAHRRGHRRGFRHGFRHARRRGYWIDSAYDVPWRRGRLMREFRYDIINRYRRMHGGAVREGRGYYYGTMEVVFDVEGTLSDAAFVVDVPSADNPVIDQCFNLAIDDVSTSWFGGPHTLNAGDTNLQNPGQNLYPDEVMIIEAVSSYLKGIRIMYPTEELKPQPTGNIHKALSGQELVWDRAGRILPIETFNQFDDTCEIARALAEVSTFYFTWSDKQLGGNRTLNNKLIGRFSQVPGTSRLGLRDAPGAGPHLDLERGYLWCLDKQFQASVDMGGNGLFDAEIHTDESVLFPFQPIRLFGSQRPVMPTGLALYWQFVVHGTSLLPGREVERYERLPRRRL